MGHDPETLTLEIFYLELRSVTDVSAAGIGEDTKAPSEEMELANRMSRLSEERIAKVYGSELDILVRQSLLQDEKWLSATSREQHNREVVIRRSTLKELIAEANREQ